MNSRKQASEFSANSIRSRIPTNYSDELIEAIAKYISEKICEPSFFKFELLLKLFLTDFMRDRKFVDAPLMERWVSLPDAKLLDLGCRTASSTVAYAQRGAEVIGVDIDLDAIRIAQMRTREESVAADFVLADARKLPFKRDSFDVCACIELLEHMPKQKEEAIYEAYRTLGRNGIIVIETPNKLFLKDYHDTDLMFLHLLPKKLAERYARLRKRMPKRGLCEYTTVFFLRNAISQVGGTIVHDAPEPRPPTRIVKFSSLKNMLKSIVGERSFLPPLFFVGLPRLLPAFFSNSLRLVVAKNPSARGERSCQEN